MANVMRPVSIIGLHRWIWMRNLMWLAECYISRAMGSGGLLGLRTVDQQHGCWEPKIDNRRRTLLFLTQELIVQGCQSVIHRVPDPLGGGVAYPMPSVQDCEK